MTSGRDKKKQCMSTRTVALDQERETGARKSVNKGAPARNGLSNKKWIESKKEFPTTNYRLEKPQAQHRMLLEDLNQALANLKNGSINRELGEEDNHIKLFIPQA
ncbi:hypothetical protein GOP47_0013873 [Adiantum capillus-veneris]|uniref:Uncharacterized protein n=1 Tax=Adiantum capillus-veneris TaxID=13818 RepID=A0A9D4UQB4_ADICA|nr:hypothetical protein GOP47_0013873 [Adiantum capillus-veneris]